MKKQNYFGAIFMVAIVAIGFTFMNFDYKVNVKPAKVKHPQKFTNINLGTFEDSGTGDVIDVWGSPSGVVDSAFIYNTTTLTDGAPLFSITGSWTGTDDIFTINVHYKITSTSTLTFYRGGTVFY